jgi:hypothetical protein
LSLSVDRPDVDASPPRTAGAQVRTRVLGPDEPLLAGEYPSCFWEARTYRDAAGDVVEEVRSYPEMTAFLRHLEEHGGVASRTRQRVYAEMTDASPGIRQMYFDELRRVMARVARLKNSALRRPGIVACRPRAARTRRRAGTHVRGSPERPSGGDDPPDDVDGSHGRART